MNRRHFLSLAAVTGVTSLYEGKRLRGQGTGSQQRNSADLITNETQDAIERGLAYLGSRQHSAGHFGRGPYSSNVGVCSLAALAFMSHGSTPGRGPYGAEVKRTVQFVLDSCQKSGFITSANFQSHGPMYGHGFATLFLAEAYGMSPNDDIAEKLKRAVQLIIDTQNSQGGWRYEPRRVQADISVSICMIMALRAARNAGLYVPNETIDRCIDYVKRSQNADGGFMYMLSGGESEFPRSAAGVVALYSAGIYDGDEIENGLSYLEKNVPRQRMPILETHFFYGHYYGIQAMWHAGGEHWQSWYPKIRDLLVNRQKSDGSWDDSIGTDYGTAMACIILQMPNNYLPIFQR